MSQTLEDAEKLFQPLPHVRLGFFPTPFYKLDRLSEKLGVNLYIKRDDFTGMNLFGGNKIRKLEYLLGEAKAFGCEYAITYGATQSNHAMETAAACRRCGIKPILYLTAVVEPDEKDVRANLLLDKILGVELHIVDIKPGETEDEAEARSFQMGAERAAELNASVIPVMTFPWWCQCDWFGWICPWFCGIPETVRGDWNQSRLYFSCDWYRRNHGWSGSRKKAGRESGKDHICNGKL